MFANYYDSSVGSVSDSLQSVYDRFVGFLPTLVAAIIVLVVGWLVAVTVAKLIKQALESLRVDELGDKLGLDQLSAKTGTKLSISGTLTWIVKWFLLIAVFLATADILGLEDISRFLNEVLRYIPNVVAAAGILLAGSMVATFLSRVVRHSVQAAGLQSAELLGSVTQWSVMIFTVLATLSQLNVAKGFVETLFTGIVGMIAIAGGLAFGLGGKEHASRVLNKIERDIKP